MKRSELHFSTLLHARAFVLLMALALQPAAFGGGTVTNLTQANLEAALAGGGSVLFATNGTILLTDTLTIGQDTVIDANGQAVTLSGGNSVRLFQVNANVVLTIKDLTLADGRVVGANGADGDPPGAGQDAAGAGILSLGGTLNLTGCVLTNHSVHGGNAGRDLTQRTNNVAVGGAGLGAAVCNLGGSVNLTNCLVGGNTAVGGQGSPFTQLPPTFGPAGPALGGAIYLSGGNAFVQNVELIQNATVGGAPQMIDGAGGSGGIGAGGAIYATNASVYFNATVLAANSATGGYPLFIGQGAGPGEGDGLGGAVCLALNTTGTVALCSFTSNSAVGGYASYSDPAGSGRGGAIYSLASCYVSGATFSGNRAVAAWGETGQRAGQGGALYSTGALVVNGCTLNGNLAQGGQGASHATGYPGGDGEGGAVWSSGLLAATNSNWATNQAVGGEAGTFALSPVAAGGTARGGGLFASAGTAILVNLTVAGNRADGATNWNDKVKGQSLGGGLSRSGGAVLVRNSIIAYSQNGGDVYYPLTDGGYNLCSDSTAGFNAPGSLNNTDPQLGRLTGNGGPTTTMIPLPSSPARDAIPSGFPATDQRGVARPQWSGGDIGAVEATDESLCSILVQPLSVVIPPGVNTNFTVVARGPLLVYQWWHDDLQVPGGTAAMLNIEGASAGAQGSYSVIVSNSVNAVTSAVATLTFDSTALNILSSPTNQTVLETAPASFSVVASGIPTIAYQWQRGGVAIDSATGSSFTIPAARPSDNGAYSVVVSNAYKVLTSAAAQLTVTPQTPVISSQPHSVLVAPGASTNFSISATGPNLAYQWWHNMTPLGGGTAAVLPIVNALAGAQGRYFVVLSNFAGMTTSAVATLTFDATALSILSQPKGVTTSAGRSANFSVLVSGIPTISYQWQHDGSPLAGATTSGLTVSALTTNDSGGYSVVVSNDYNALLSASAQLVVWPYAVPPLLACSRSAGNLTITFNAEAGKSYRLLVSGDLSSWVSVATNPAAGDGALQFVQPIAAPQFYYRVVTP